MRRRYQDDGTRAEEDLEVLQRQMTPRVKGKQKRPMPALLAVVLLVITILVIFVLIVHELYYYRVLDQVDLGFPPSHPVIPSLSIPLNQASISVVSLHRGVKFAGYLGQWLSDQKSKYARYHGYAYANERDFPSDEEKLFQLSEWQNAYHRRVKFDKLRFLLYLMETYPNLRYLLWLDADAVVTEATIQIEERVKHFSRLHQEDFCFAWAQDATPNTGVLLLVNQPTTRQLIRTSLSTFSETQVFMDQASFTKTVESNSTYSSCQLLLPSVDTTLLQSRVRGRESMQWKRGDWILHLPNHNRLEMLQSLSKWLTPNSDSRMNHLRPTQ